jgi:hypothetical protein
MVCAKPLILKDLSAGSTYDNEARQGYRPKAKTSPASILCVLAAFSNGIQVEVYNVGIAVDMYSNLDEDHDVSVVKVELIYLAVGADREH